MSATARIAQLRKAMAPQLSAWRAVWEEENHKRCSSKRSTGDECNAMHTSDRSWSRDVTAAARCVLRVDATGTSGRHLAWLEADPKTLVSNDAFVAELQFDLRARLRTAMEHAAAQAERKHARQQAQLQRMARLIVREAGRDAKRALKAQHKRAREQAKVARKPAALQKKQRRKNGSSSSSSSTRVMKT